MRTDRPVPLHRLLYRSEVDILGSEAEVQAEVVAIVRAAQSANARAGLTGALVYVRGTFVQAMEGPIGPVEATFERICCDLRHRQVELLEFVPATERVFAQWSMARVTPGLGFHQVLPDRHAEGNAGAPSTKAIIEHMRATLMKRDGPVFRSGD